MMHDIKSQAPTAICEIDPTMISFNLLVNRDNPPFDDPDIRRAMMLTIDRKAFLDIISEGQGQIGGAMQSPPAGLWGLPPEILQTLPGYGPDVAASRAEARKLMEKHGYGPNKRLAVKVADPQHRAIPRPGGDPDRPDEADLYRRRARRGRDRELVSQDRPQGLHGRRQSDRQRGRRPRRLFLRALRLRLGAQLHQLLQPRARKDVRAAIDGARPGKAQEAGLGDRPQADRGRAPGRSSTATTSAPATTRGCTGSRRWSTASSTAGASRTPGSTNSRRDYSAACASRSGGRPSAAPTAAIAASIASAR